MIFNAPFDEHVYKDEIGIKVFWGELGFSTYERTWIRLTLELIAIWGGYIGEGAKTVVPA